MTPLHSLVSRGWFNVLLELCHGQSQRVSPNDSFWGNIPLLRRGGVLAEIRMSFAFPLRRALRVLLYPRTTLPDLITRASCDFVSKASRDGGFRAAHLGADGLGVILALLGGHCDGVVCRLRERRAGRRLSWVSRCPFEGEENRKYHLHNPLVYRKVATGSHWLMGSVGCTDGSPNRPTLSLCQLLGSGRIMRPDW